MLLLLYHWPQLPSLAWDMDSGSGQFGREELASVELGVLTHPDVKSFWGARGSTMSALILAKRQMMGMDTEATDGFYNVDEVCVGVMLNETAAAAR